MTNVTLKQKVAVILAESSQSVMSEFFNSDADYDNESFTEADIKFKLMSRHGGESEGEDYWSVYKFTSGTDGVFVKFDGYYYSYDGSTFDSWFFVTPKEVMVTQYVKVQE
jgi:hypothetical protein